MRNYLQVNVSNDSYDDFIRNYCITNKVYLIINKNLNINKTLFQSHFKNNEDIDNSVLTFKFKRLATEKYTYYSTLFYEIKNNIFINLDYENNIFIIIYNKLANISKILNSIHYYPNINIENISKIIKLIPIISDNEFNKNKTNTLNYLKNDYINKINGELSKIECNNIAKKIIIKYNSFNYRKKIEIGCF